jgi:hypothetical protein
MEYGGSITQDIASCRDDLREQIRLNVKVNKHFIHVPAGTDNYGTVSGQWAECKEE